MQDQYAGMETVFRKTLFLLRLLIRENHKVQERMFDNLDQLLDVQIVRSDLALALKEVCTLKKSSEHLILCTS